MSVVKKYKLDAKKAFEFARGNRVIVSDYRTRSLRRSESAAKIELSNEDQEIFLTDYYYAYRYAKHFKKRLCEQVEEKFFQNASNELDVKYCIDYCAIFDMVLPENLLNRTLMQSAVPSSIEGMNRLERRNLRIAQRKQKRYLSEFQEKKKNFKILLERIIKDNNLSENHTIKDLMEVT